MNQTAIPQAVSDLEGIGNVIRQARTSRGWSQWQLADRAGFHGRREVIRIEAGRSVHASTLFFVLRALGLHVEVAS